MKKEIRSNFAQINEQLKLIELFNNPPRTNGLETTLENVVIEIEDSTLKIKGYKWLWDIDFNKRFVEDMEEKPIENHTYLGYKSLLDYFKGIKKPYVKCGWCRLQKTEWYYAEMNQWFISF